jgi:hypothetical protein
MHVLTLGTNITTGEGITLADVDRRQHLYCVGGSGAGKTNWLLSLMAQDLAAGSGFCFIDKHGDAAKQLADSAPCIYWKPADLSHCVGLNPLQNVPPDERWKITADITAIFSDIWGLGEQTPRLLYYLRAAIRLLLDTNGSTLMDIRRVVSDENYRARLVRACSDSETIQTWNEFNAKPAKDQSLEVGSLQNKVAALADPLPLRFVIGQPTSTINIGKLMDTGQVLIVDLSGMGDEPAHLLGALIVSQFSQAAETRATIAEHERRDFTLYIDEFQNFASRAFERILSEARKWRLSLVLAHQFAAQIETIMPAILGNCGTVVSFRLGADDAHIIGRAIGRPEADLLDLPRGHAWARVMKDGQPYRALPMQTRRVKLATGHLRASIANTRASYSRPRRMVERPKRNAPLKRRGWGN